ncbi:porin, partial [Methylobacterium radiotolerans]
MRIAFFAALAAAGLMPHGRCPFRRTAAPRVQLYGIVDAGVAVTRVSGQGSQSGLLN